MTERREVRYEFTREELRELGHRLALKAQEILDARAEKKLAAGAYASKINALEEQALIIVRALNERAEMREMDCRVEYHLPRNGMKTIYRSDTGVAIAEEPMTPAELQQPLAFEDAPPAKAKPKTQ
jgi:hypothetical protein